MDPKTKPKAKKLKRNGELAPRTKRVDFSMVISMVISIKSTDVFFLFFFRGFD